MAITRKAGEIRPIAGQAHTFEQKQPDGSWHMMSTGDWRREAERLSKSEGREIDVETAQGLYTELQESILEEQGKATALGVKEPTIIEAVEGDAPSTFDRLEQEVTPAVTEQGAASQADVEMQSQGKTVGKIPPQIGKKQAGLGSMSKADRRKIIRRMLVGEL